MRIRLLIATLLGLAGVGLTASPAHAAVDPQPSIYGLETGGPTRAFDTNLSWQKPSHDGAESCGQVTFYFDGRLLGTANALNENYSCVGRWYGAPPASDRGPGKHTVRAVPHAAGVPSRSIIYTIVGTVASTKKPTPTRKPTPAKRTTPTKGAPTTANPAPVTVSPPASSQASSAEAEPSGSGATGSGSPSVLPVLLVSGPDDGGGLGSMGWLLAVLGVAVLGGGGAAAALFVRRSRSAGAGEL